MNLADKGYNGDISKIFGKKQNSQIQNCQMKSFTASKKKHQLRKVVVKTFRKIKTFGKFEMGIKSNLSNQWLFACSLDAP